MSLTARELNQLKKIAAIANQMIAKAEANLAAAEAKAAVPAKAPDKKAAVKADAKAWKKAAPKPTKVIKASKPAAKKGAAKSVANEGKRTRRRGDELVAFRAMLAEQRNSGVPVVTLAKQHGVSTAYIYSI